MNIKENNKIETKGYASAGAVVSKAFSVMERLYGHGLMEDYVSTGYQEIDHYTGFMSGNLVCIAGSSGGLSTLVMNLFSRLNRATDESIPALLFSLQHNPVYIGRQLLALESRLLVQNLLRARLRDSHWPALACAAGKLSDASTLYVCPKPASDIEGIIQQADLFIQEVEPGLRVMFIDSLQLILSTDRQEDNCLRALKAWARDHEVTVVITSRLRTRRNSRTGLERPNNDRLHRMLQTYADVVLQVTVRTANGIADKMKDENGYHFAYDHASGMVVWMPDNVDIVKYPMELTLLKNSNGPIGSIPLTFIPQQCLIESRASN